MPSLQVRDLPEPLYRMIQVQAKKEHRSLAQQAIIILKRGLHWEENPRFRRQQLLNKIGATNIQINMDKYPPPEKLIREDRDR